MSRSSFAALLQKYQSGLITPAERIVVEQWYVLLGEEPRGLSTQEWEELEIRLWQKLRSESVENDETEVPVKVFSNRNRNSWIAVAASILFLLSFAIYFSGEKEQIADESGQALRRMENRGPSVLSLTLEDGSRLFLNPGAELQYPLHFTSQKREVFLKGEAFFEVSEDPKRPFYVNAGQITTKVLGTSFRMKAPLSGMEVQVSVKTGKVSVYERETDASVQSSKNGSGVILSPNHEVTFLKRNKLFLTRIVDNPVALPVTDQKEKKPFNYYDTELSKVIAELEEAYSIDLEFERKVLEDCPFTANLSKKGLYQQLDLICAAIQGTYEVKGTTILINGQGCE